MTTDIRLTGRLVPIKPEHRWKWWLSGLAVQFVTVGAAVAWAYNRFKHDSVAGATLRTTLTLVWKEMLHEPAGVGLLVVAAIGVAVGGVLLARPHVTNLWVLLVAVPVGAIAGLLILGAAVLLISILYFIGDAIPSGGGSSRKKKDDPSR